MAGIDSKCQPYKESNKRLKNGGTKFKCTFRGGACPFQTVPRKMTEHRQELTLKCPF